MTQEKLKTLKCGLPFRPFPIRYRDDGEDGQVISELTKRVQRRRGEGDGRGDGRWGEIAHIRSIATMLQKVKRDEVVWITCEWLVNGL